MDYINVNIKYLVDKEGIGQDPFGDRFELKRGAIGSYINGKAKPKIETLQNISVYFNILIDDLVNKDISKLGQTIVKKSNENYQERNTIENLMERIRDKDKTIQRDEDVIQLLKDKLKNDSMNSSKVS